MIGGAGLAGVGLAIGAFILSDGSEESRRMITRQDGWRLVSVGDFLVFRVPADARDRAAQPIDSLAGLIDGPGYEITYDYGRFSERIEVHKDRPGYSISVGRLGSRRMQKGSFLDVENNPRLPVARVLRVEDGASALTLRISCADEATCAFADALLGSVEFRE
jgi:hypothetical protein